MGTQPVAASARQPESNVTSVAEWMGRDSQGEYLLTIWSDGSRSVAWRAQSWETWSPQVELALVPVSEVAS